MTVVTKVPATATPLTEALPEVTYSVVALAAMDFLVDHSEVAMEALLEELTLMAVVLEVISHLAVVEAMA